MHLHVSIFLENFHLATDESLKTCFDVNVWRTVWKRLKSQKHISKVRRIFANSRLTAAEIVMLSSLLQSEHCLV